MNNRSYLTDIPCDTFPMDDLTMYHDPICGEYGITARARELVDSLGCKDRLTCVLAQKNLREGKTNIIITDGDQHTPENWNGKSFRELIKLYPGNPLDIIDNALINISLALSHPSDVFFLDKQTKWLIYSHDEISLNYFANQLSKLNYIQITGQYSDDGLHTVMSILIEPQGWKRLAYLNSIRPDSKQAFVAMWFNPLETEDTYKNGIAPAIEEAGYKCVRIDNKEHNNKICDEIIAEIRRSRFLVADFCGHRGGVYFEAGFASGLNIPVIFTVHEEHLDKVHFDTRQYNHIVYKSPEELKTKLINRIRATVF